MDKRTKTLLEEIISEFGSENVNAGEVAKLLGNEHQLTLIKNGVRVSSNVYSINLNDTVSSEIEEPQQNSKVTQFSKIKDLVPDFDSTYVPFGCYNEILTIVKSNHFLPVYIVGESGNR